MDLTLTVSNKDTSPQLTSTTVVQINVLDLNDKTPEFESRFYNQTISEASPSGTAVVTVSANDKDKVCLSHSTMRTMSLHSTKRSFSLPPPRE